MKNIITFQDLLNFTEECINNDKLDDKNLATIRVHCRLFKVKLKDILREYFWDINKTMTYNALFNFIIGNRGGGKSFGAKERAIDNFIKKGEQFGYIRRYKDDLSGSMPTFFNDIAEDYPDYEFKSDASKFYIRKKPDNEKQKWTEADIAGYGFVLSTGNNKKSIPYPHITMLVYDEFLLDEEGNVKYIKGEVRALLNLYETVARPGSGHPRVTLWCLANALSVTNPYFLEFKLCLPTKKDGNGKLIWRHPKNSILVEDVQVEAFMKQKQKSEFGQIVAGTSYGDYSINNKMLFDDDTFVEKRTQKARNIFNFVYMGYKFGVWFDSSLCKMWVSESFDPSRMTYSFTTKDHKPDTTLLKSRYKSSQLQRFIEGFKDGSLYFENINIKNMCFDIIKMFLY